MSSSTYNQHIAAKGLFLRELKRLGSPTGIELTAALDAKSRLARIRDADFDFVFRVGATSYELIDAFVECGFVEAVSIPGGHRPLLAWEWNTARIRISARGLNFLSVVESEAVEEMKIFDDDPPPVFTT